MGKFDQGLGAIGTLALAGVLSVLLTVGIPLVLAREPIRASDWLGFAGSIGGAMVTLIAAVLAWRAVQKQVEVQRDIADRQSALVAFKALRNLSTLIAQDQRFMREIRFSAYQPVRRERFRFQTETISIASFNSEKAKFERDKKQIRRLANRSLKTNDQIHSIVDVKQRNKIRDALKALDEKFGKAQKEFNRIAEMPRPDEVFLSAVAVAACKQITVLPDAKLARSAADGHLVVLKKEATRIADLLREARRRASL